MSGWLAGLLAICLVDLLSSGTSEMYPHAKLKAGSWDDSLELKLE